MSQQQLLKRVVAALDGAGVDYMVTGSVASSLQGEPRSTHDLDLVVAMRSADVAALLASFPHPQFYLDESAIREALATGERFNLLESAEGNKVDFRLITEDSFDQSRFSRKYVVDVFGLALRVSAPEDTILQKLRWVRETGGSEKAFLDALRVYEVQFDALDLAYIEEWVSRLSLEELWNRLQAEAEPI